MPLVHPRDLPTVGETTRKRFSEYDPEFRGTLAEYCAKHDLGRVVDEKTGAREIQEGDLAGYPGRVLVPCDALAHPAGAQEKMRYGLGPQFFKDHEKYARRACIPAALMNDIQAQYELEVMEVLQNLPLLPVPVPASKVLWTVCHTKTYMVLCSHNVIMLLWCVRRWLHEVRTSQLRHQLDQADPDDSRLRARLLLELDDAQQNNDDCLAALDRAVSRFRDRARADLPAIFKDGSDKDPHLVLPDLVFDLSLEIIRAHEKYVLGFHEAEPELFQDLTPQKKVTLEHVLELIQPETIHNLEVTSKQYIRWRRCRTLEVEKGRKLSKKERDEIMETEFDTDSKAMWKHLYQYIHHFPECVGQKKAEK